MRNFIFAVWENRESMIGNGEKKLEKEIGERRGKRERRKGKNGKEKSNVERDLIF